MFSNFQICQKISKLLFKGAQVNIYPTYFLKLYLDPYYGDRSTVFTDKIGTQLGTEFPSW